MKKRVISLLLAICLLPGPAPIAVRAEDDAVVAKIAASAEFVGSGGDGKEEDPYLISSFDDLEAFRDYINSDDDGGSGEYFKLTADIDMSDEYSEDGTSWTPIGTISNGFKGEFDGDGHTVKVSLSYTDSTVYYVGLFGLVDNDAMISNLSVSGSISSMNDNAAVGGIAGELYGHIDRCYSSVNITGNGSIGGIAGRNTIGHIANCYNTGDITSSSTSNDDGAGGIVGRNLSGIENCYNTGKITLAGGGAAAVGGIAGTGNSGTISNCYYLTGTAEKGVGGTDDAAGTVVVKTAEEFKTLASALNDRGSVWKDALFLGRPVFTAFPEGGDGTAAAPYTIPDLATLEAFREYINASKGSGKYFKLTANIDMSGKYKSNTSWTPIGANTTSFKGTFDGDGHTISGLYISTTSFNQGLFGNSSGTVKNLIVSGSVTGGSSVGGIVGVNNGIITDCRSDCNVKGTSDVGGIAGENYSNIKNCYNTGTVSHNNNGTNKNNIGGIAGYSNSNGNIENCHNTGEVNGKGGYVGGIEGYNYGGSIENCHNEGKVTGAGDYTGGIAGHNDSSGRIRNCHNTGSINGTASVGGIVGHNNGNTFENCYNTGTVNGTGDYVGGIVGTNLKSMKNCYNEGTVSGSNQVGGIAGSSSNSVQRCFNVGAVSGNAEIGAIVGQNTGSSVANCYYLNPYGGENVGTSKTAEQFASGEVAWLLQNGQSTPAWGQKLGAGADEYPVLTTDSDKKVCKVTFRADNSDYAVRYANLNGTVTLPEPPTKDGYTFKRWSQSNNANGAEFNASTNVTGDMTVYAVGQNTFGGDSADIALTTTYGTALTENLSQYVAYKTETATAGQFNYEITAGNDTLNATIGGDILTIPGTANAGEYTITVTAREKEPQYSLMSVGSYGTNDVTLTVNVSIAKAESSVTEAPTANNLTYNGAAQELVTAGTAIGGEMRYSLEQSGGYSATVPTGINAKAYTVWYKVVGDANHDGTSPQSIPVTIGKATATVTPPTPKTSLTYNGEPQQLVTAGSATGGTMQYSLTGEDDYVTDIPTGEDAKSYTVYWKVEGADTTNYSYSATSGQVTVTITKANATVTPPVGNAGLTYNGKPQQLVEAGSATGGEMRYSLTQSGEYSTTVPTGINAGTYNVWYKVIGDENHDGTEPAKIDVTIAKASATVTVPTARELTYTGAAQELITKGSVASDVEGCGTMQYSLTEGSGFSADIPTGEDAKEYTVYWKVEGADETNYEYDGEISGQVTVTIDKATATVKAPTSNSLTYTGAAQPLVMAGSVASDVEGYGEMRYSLSEGSGFSADIPTGEDSGTYIVYWKVDGADTTNYEYSAETSGQVTVTIGKATATVKAPTANSLTYTGEPQPLVTAGSVTSTVAGYGEMRYRLSEESGFSADIPTGENSGTYIVYWKVEGADTTNYNYNGGTGGKVTVTIGKGEADVTAAGVTVTYGEEVTLTVNVALRATNGIALTGAAQDEVEFVFPKGEAQTAKVVGPSGESGTASVTIPAAEVKKYLNPGQNTVTVNYGGSGNLNGKDSVTMTVMVEPKILNFSFAADSRDYNGSTVVTGSLTPTERVGSDDVTAALREGGATASSADAGTQTVTVDSSKVTLGGEDAGYYKVGAATGGTVTISKATIGSFMLPTVERTTYNGTEQALLSGSVSVPEGATITYFAGGKNDSSAPSGSEDGWGAMDAVKAKDAGTYTVWYRVAGGTNYEDVGPTKIGEAAILPKEVTLAWKLDGGETFTVDYTGGAHTVTATATNPVEGDVCRLTVGENGVQTNAGTYTAKITDISNENYSLPDDITREYTINRAPVTFAIDAEDKPAHDWTTEVNADPNPDGYAIAEDTDTVVWNDFALSMTYDSLEHTANVRQSGGVPMGGLFSVSYKRVKDAEGNAVAEDSAATFRAAGTYEILVTLKDNPENFKFAGEEPDVRTLCIGTVTVEPYEVRVTWQNLTFVYHGHAMHPTVRVENAFVADEQPDESEKQKFLGDLTAFDGDLMAYAVTDSADAKNYTVTVSLYGSEAGNYTVSNPTADVVIQPAPVVFEVTNNEWLYNEEARERDVTLTAAWGEVTNAPDTVLGDSYPGAGTEIALEDLGVTAGDIQYRLADGTAVDDPTETGTYQVWVRIPNANFRHAGSSGGDFRNVGVLRIAASEHPATYTVTFDPGRDEQGNLFDGVTVPEPMENLIPTQEITLPTAPKNAPAGYAFAGWSRGGALYQPGEKFCMPYSDVTFEARWTKEVFNISGVVIDDEETHVPYVSVTLMMGEHQISLTTTDENGYFSFSGLIPNIYNLVFTWNGIVKTYMVEITDANVEGETYALPGYRLNTVVEVAPGSGSVVVDLDPIITDEAASELYSANEKELVQENGGTVEFRMKVEDSSAAAGMAEKLEEVPVSAENIGMVLDMNLTKTVTELKSDGTADTTVTPINDSKALIANLIYLPAELQGKDGYTVYRFHEGADEVQTITTVPNEEGEHIEVVKDGTAIMVYARYYSTYVLTWYQNTQARGVIVVPAAPHGTVTPDAQTAVPGSKVTFVVKPDEGCELDTLTVTDGNGQEVPLTDNGDGSYSFVMPAGNVVTVHAAFHECPSLRFPDLDVTKWYHRFTDYVIARAVMNGHDTGLFVPEGNVTRAEMVTVLWNMADRAESDAEMPYTDVMGDAWYCEAVRWATEAGIANGYGDDTFRPDREITREEMAAMLYRYETNVRGDMFEDDPSGELDFPDKNEIHSWAQDAMSWCVANKLFEGDDTGLLRPGDNAGRAALAKILTAYMELGAAN